MQRILTVNCWTRIQHRVGKSQGDQWKTQVSKGLLSVSNNSLKRKTTGKSRHKKKKRINDKTKRDPSNSLHKMHRFMIGCKVNERRFSFSTHRLLSKKKLQSH